MEENIMMCFLDFFKWVKNNITSNWRESCQTRVSIVRREDGVSDWALFIQENGREVRLHRYLMDYYADYDDGKPLENIIKSMRKDYEDKVNNIITKEQFESLITIYNNDRDNYKEKIKFINNEIIYYKEKEKNNDNDEKILCKYQEFSKLNRIIIQEFIDKIYIGKINKEVKVRDIKIKWNFNMLEENIKVL